MRHKDLEWDLPAGNPTHPWESIHAALLMDLRDELKAIRGLLQCHRVSRAVRAVETIAENTTRRPRRKKAAA